MPSAAVVVDSATTACKYKCPVWVRMCNWGPTGVTVGYLVCCDFGLGPASLKIACKKKELECQRVLGAIQILGTAPRLVYGLWEVGLPGLVAFIKGNPKICAPIIAMGMGLANAFLLPAMKQRMLVCAPDGKDPVEVPPQVTETAAQAGEKVMKAMGQDSCDKSICAMGSKAANIIFVGCNMFSILYYYMKKCNK